MEKSCHILMYEDPCTKSVFALTSGTLSVILYKLRRHKDWENIGGIEIESFLRKHALFFVVRVSIVVAVFAAFLASTFPALADGDSKMAPGEAPSVTDVVSVPGDISVSNKTLPEPRSEARSGKRVVVKETEVIPGDLIVGCKELQMNGIVRSSLLAGGLALNIDNSVGKDINAAGYNVILRGSVREDARLGGINVVVDGHIDGDLMVLGANIAILGDISGDVTVRGGNVRVSGNIAGELNGCAGTMIIDGTIGRNVTLTVSNLALYPKAVLKGSLTYTSNRSADIEQGATITGSVERKAGGSQMALWWLATVVANRFPQDPGKLQEWEAQLPGWFRVLFSASAFFSLLVAGLIIISVYERHATLVADRILSSPLGSLGMGLLFLVTAPVAIIVLAFTIIGIPISFVVLAACIVVIYISRVYVALLIGRTIFDHITKQDVRSVWPMILGLIIVTALSSIPYHIGLVVKVVSIAIGLGGLLVTKKREAL